jgi:hypothetical protein
MAIIDQDKNSLEIIAKAHNLTGNHANVYYFKN